MLFNSFSFIFLFLPITVAVFFLFGRSGKPERGLIWLTLASLFFYGWWNPAYLLLILASILTNFHVGRTLGHDGDPGIRKVLLVLGISLNLGFLVYFKYMNLLVDTVNHITGTDVFLDEIVLPLAISFFTFQQIAYLVDAYRNETHEYSFSHYCLFVCFFPQLIAGPIVHHKEMLSQFMRSETFRVSTRNFAIGLSMFTMGLFKKVVLADGIATYSTPVFTAAESPGSGGGLLFYDAWTGSLAYTFQIYFDFSGYSDMAIGLGRLFGIKLPLNFHSPYKSASIIDFWRQWHLTLSRFLREYLYFALGGNRHGKIKRYRNLMITMLLGGIWHGAGWNFAIWGGLHGIYLVINHGWRGLTAGHGVAGPFRKITRASSVLLTFIAVVVAWVFFKAESFSGAMNMVEAMLGFNGIPALSATEPIRLVSTSAFGWCGLLALICWVMPNTQEIMRNFQPAVNIDRYVDMAAKRFIQWRPTRKWALLLALMFVVAVASMNHITEFLYFQF